MRIASTQARGDAIVAGLANPSFSSCVEISSWRNGAWEIIQDLDEEIGVKWSAAGMRFDYTTIPVIPATSNINFTIRNFNGKYSPGSGTAFDGLIDADTKIRLRGGYPMSDYSERTVAATPVHSYYYMKPGGAGLVSDPANTLATTNKFYKGGQELYGDRGPTYGDAGYDQGIGGYVVFRKILTNERDPALISKVSVVAKSTNFKVYAITKNAEGLDEEYAANWIYLGRTTNGTTNFPVTMNGRIIYILCVQDGGQWGEEVDTASVTYQDKVEWIYTAIFYLDTPEYNDPSPPEIPTITCSGRDNWKRAVETTYNLPSLSPGMTIDDAIKMVLDAIGIPYTATSIADLAAFGNRTLTTGLGSSKPAEKVIEYLMQCTWQKGQPRFMCFMKYDPVVDDQVFYLVERPSTFASLFVFSYQNMEMIGARRKNYDKMVKRYGVFTKKEDQGPEELLASGTWTQANAGDNILYWGGNAQDKRIVYTVNYGNPVLQLSNIASPITPTQVSFNLSGSGSYSINVYVYGCPWSGTPPTYQGEAISFINMVANKGKVLYIENPLIVSDSEASLIAEAFVEDYGDPDYEIGNMGHPYLNLLFDVLDTALVWSRVNFIQTIFYVTNVNYDWSRSGSPSQKTTYTLTDTGYTLADLGGFRYDMGFLYDVGWLYDMPFGPQATEDLTNYDYLKPVQCS